MLDVDRERAIRGLRERYARGDLNAEELDEKLNALFTTQSSAEPEPSPASAASDTELDTVERHLSPGERIEWAGRPDPAKHFTRSDVYLVPFSILWGGFAIFWETAAIRGGGGVFFVLWGIPFVAMGLYLMLGRFVYKASRKRRTVYAVTNRRVLTIVRGRGGESVETVDLRSIPSIFTNGGNVEFGFTSGGSSANSGLELFARGPAASAGVGFYDIEDPRGVAELIERLRASR